MALLIVYLVTVAASDKCKKRRAWPTLNLLSASMLLAESVTNATEFWRHVEATLQSNRNNRGLNTSCIIRWNVMVTVCFFERHVTNKLSFENKVNYYII